MHVRRFIVMIAVIAATALALIGCGAFSSDKEERAVTISCANEMFVGDRIEVKYKKSFNFDMNAEDNVWEIVGENKVDGSFEFINSSVYFRANKAGAVKIRLTNSTGAILESNTVEIKVTAQYIYTAVELSELADSDKKVVLGQDIDLSPIDNWTPIANFSGILMGDGHAISNLKTVVKSKDNIGLFAELNGTVSNLKLKNVSITGSGSGNNVGAIAGLNKGIIENCEVDGVVNCEYSVNVGGIAGFSCTGMIGNKNNAAVKSVENVGGIAGYVEIYGDGKFENNENNGKILGDKNVGGLFGNFTACEPAIGEFEISVFDCKNTGEVNSDGDCIGGIAGRISGFYADYSKNWGHLHATYITVIDCENNAVIKGRDYIGGIYGKGENYITNLTACVNTADIEGGNYVGGYAGYSKDTEMSNMNNNKMIVGKGYLGGIAGYAGIVKNCKNTADITAVGIVVENNISKNYVGGIVGYCTGISHCTNGATISTVDAVGENVGGIAGYLDGASLCDNNDNSGRVLATPCNKVGGIAGALNTWIEIFFENNVNSGDVSGNACVGGVIGRLTCVEPGIGTFDASVVECENSGSVYAGEAYAGGIVGCAGGYYISYSGGGHVHAMNVVISDNINSGKVASAGDYAAILGKAYIYVNVNEILWATNKNHGEVGNGKLYN